MSHTSTITTTYNLVLKQFIEALGISIKNMPGRRRGTATASDRPAKNARLDDAL